MATLGRRWFALVYRVIDPPLRRATASARRTLVRNLRGVVLDVGAGLGSNFEYFNRDARCLAIDVNEHLLLRARRNRDRSAATVDVCLGDAQALPLPDDAVDAYVATLVLCSVPDLEQAVAEAWRVLRPGGELRLLEHVRSSTPWKARLQTLLTPAWRIVADGCHLDRDTESTVRAQGFEITAVRRDGNWSPLPVLMLWARKPLPDEARQAGFTAET